MRLLLSVCLLIVSVGSKAQQIQFVKNAGQWHENVEFKSSIPAGDLYLEKNRLTFNFVDQSFIHNIHEGGTDSILNGHAFYINFVGANKNPIIKASKGLDELVNYYLGNDPKKWAKGLHPYLEVYYQNLYPNIDFKIYSKGSSLKYDFIVHKGGVIKDIKMEVEGASEVNVLQNGNLNIKTTINQIFDDSPISFQGEDQIPTAFKLEEKTVSFIVRDYDESEDLIIDPTLIFSTYSGSFADNFGYTATYDEEGFLYAGGSVFNSGYPTTPGAYQTNFASYSHIDCGGFTCWGISDIAITKYDTSGTKRIYSTYLGGVNCELPHSLIVNSKDELYIFGTTSSNNYPTTLNAFDQVYNPGGSLNLANGVYVNYQTGSDIVISRLSKDGTGLIGSTYLGGDEIDGLNALLTTNYADQIRGEIILDKNENVLIGTSTFSANLGFVGAGFQSVAPGGQDGLIVKMSPDLDNVLWGSYYGGSGNDAICSIINSNDDNIYIAGGTTSADLAFPAGAFQSAFQGGDRDGFYAKINGDGTGISNGSYFGTDARDHLFFVREDKLDQIAVYGQSNKTGNPWIQNATYSVPDAFQVVAKFNSTQTGLDWSTTFGPTNPSQYLSPTAFLVDLCNKVYLSAYGPTGGMEVTPNAFKSNSVTNDFYLMVLEYDASSLWYASFFGGDLSNEHVDGGTSRFDNKGVVYQSVCAGCGGNSDFPIEPANAVGPINNGQYINIANDSFPNCNNGVFKFNFEIPGIVADFIVPNNFCITDSLAFVNTSKALASSTYLWDFGDGNSSTETHPKHLYALAGNYDIKLIISDTNACNLADSIVKSISISAPISADSGVYSVCKDSTFIIGVDPRADPSTIYEWFPKGDLSDSTISKPTINAQEDYKYTLVVKEGFCPDTYRFEVEVFDMDLLTDGAITGCNIPDSALLNLSSSGATNYEWSNQSDFSTIIQSGPNDTTLKVGVNLNKEIYYVNISNGVGCRDTDSIIVQRYDFDLIFNSEEIACLNDTISIAPQDYLQYDSVSFNWAPDSLLISAPSDTVARVFSNSGIHQVFVTSYAANGCMDVDTILIKIAYLDSSNLSATASKDSINQYQSSLLTALPLGYNYNWEEKTTIDEEVDNTAIVSPKETTNYLVEFSDTLVPGCKDTAWVKVTVVDVLCEEPYIYVPNAFSPNGDGKNDVLYVRGSSISELLFVVYNRWGQKVFETDDINYGWDGFYKGMKIDPAVYDYYLTYKCFGQEEHFKKGNITLIR